SNDPMALVAATATAMAAGGFSTPTSGVEMVTPVEIFTTPSETPAIEETETSMPPFIIITPGAEITPTTMLPTIPPVAFTPGSIPSVYTLRPGEFPYCIARRFDVDPQELLRLNGLSDGMIYQPGLQLRIPQTGNPFPGERALKPHPATYTVTKADMTIYAVACEFGDVSPEAIAAANNLPLSTSLTLGQVLQIP
ncbi:MAG: LysM peptidoglycan-binding domain-containing protein, partial [Anaerolineales bacterium]